MRGARMWIQDLREVCERCYDDHEEGQRLIGELRAEWNEASARLEVEASLLDGLERRADKLLQADAEAWLGWLDDEEFWNCLLYTSPSPRDQRGSRMPSSA